MAKNLNEAVDVVAKELDMSVYDILHSVDVSKNLMKKEGGKDKQGNPIYLDYLECAVVYETLNTYFCGEWSFEEIDATNGCNYFTDGRTAWVKVAIEIRGIKHTATLPIMDYRNNSIALDRITSRDVNDAQKRCLVKCACYHGLGTSVFCKADDIIVQSVEESQKQLHGAIEKVKACKTAEELNELIRACKQYYNEADFVSACQGMRNRLNKNS